MTDERHHHVTMLPYSKEIDRRMRSNQGYFMQFDFIILVNRVEDIDGVPCYEVVTTPYVQWLTSMN